MACLTDSQQLTSDVPETIPGAVLRYWGGIGAILSGVVAVFGGVGAMFWAVLASYCGGIAAVLARYCYSVVAVLARCCDAISEAVSGR